MLRDTECAPEDKCPSPAWPAVGFRIQPGHKGCLQVLCQRLASFGVSAKHLDTAVSGIRVIILVNAEKNAVFVSFMSFTRFFRSETFFWAMVWPVVYTDTSSRRMSLVS